MNENQMKINKLKKMIKRHETAFAKKTKELEELHECDYVSADKMHEILNKLQENQKNKEMKLQEKLKVPIIFKRLEFSGFDIDSRVGIRCILSSIEKKIQTFFESGNLFEKKQIIDEIYSKDDIDNELDDINRNKFREILKNMEDHLEELEYIKEGE